MKTLLFLLSTPVLIGVVVAVGLVLVPRLMSKSKDKACCTNVGGKWSNNTCNPVSGIEYNEDDYNTCVADD